VAAAAHSDPALPPQQPLQPAAAAASSVAFGSGATTEVSISQAGCGGATWDTPPTAGGGGAITTVETYGEDSRSVFEQPLRFAPARLVAGESHPCGSPMAVTLLSSGKPRASGTARRNLRISGEAEIDLHGERLRATVVEVEFVAELDAATARRVSELFVVEDRGIVAEQWRERLLILGVIPRNSRETLAIEPSKGGTR
jgi:hypothetical protein